MLAPDKPEDPCQFIDSRDLAEWTIRMAEMRELGTFNAIGPDKPLTIAEMLYGVKAITTAGAQFTWVPWEFLQKHERSSVAAHDGLATALRPHGRLSAPGRLKGDREGADLPSARRDGEGHARLAQDASAKRAARDAER